MKNEVLVHQDYWDKGYADLKPWIAPPEDPVRQWIESKIPLANAPAHALEVGCYPGRYLAVLGNLGYTVHGVDLTPGVTTMPEAFTRMGFAVGEFTRADFLRHDFHRTYEVVCSFGFIEHFTDWGAVLTRHAQLVAPGGTLLIETPNFSGPVQGFFHRWLDAENYARHNPAAMDPRDWATLLRSQGFEVQQATWMGRFTFWHHSSGNSLSRRIGFIVLRWLTPMLARMGTRSRSLSPYAVLVARRK
jgi:L-malate glycosyltransferase